MAHLTIKSNEPTFHARENVSDCQKEKEKRLEKMSHGHYLNQLHRNHDREQLVHRNSTVPLWEGFGLVTG